MWAGERDCALRGQGSPSEHPPNSHPNSDLHLILSTGQGEIAKPLRCKTSLSLSVWLPPPTPSPPHASFHLCGLCRLGAHCEPVCGLFFLCLSGLLVRVGGWEGGRRGGGVAGETKEQTAGLLSSYASGQPQGFTDMEPKE